MQTNQCKQCRRAGKKLFLKGERCFTVKCALTKKPYTPGAHKILKTNIKLSEYGKLLRAKQELKQMYGISERQFKKYIKEVLKKKEGDKRVLLLKILEKRLDNAIFRAGLTASRRAARQIVSHNHILINNKKVNIPSFEVKKNQIIALKEKSEKSPLFENLTIYLKKHKMPSWLKLNPKNEIEVIDEPQRIDLGNLEEAQIALEFYSR